MKALVLFLVVAFSGLLLLGSMPAQAQSSANSSTVENDITAAEDGGGTVSSSNNYTAVLDWFNPRISALRNFAVVLLLILLAVAAIMAAQQKTSLALSVAIGAIVLFGGFWMFAMVSGSLGENEANLSSVNYSSAADSSASGQDYALTTSGGTSTKGKRIAAPVYRAVVAGLDILSSAIIPFIVIYGFLLAVTFATQGADPSAGSAFIIGACIVIGAATIAQIFNVIASTT